jgi:capsular exopolysaccharide synthesis family protein
LTLHGILADTYARDKIAKLDWSLAVEAHHFKWDVQRPELPPPDFNVGSFLPADPTYTRLGPRQSTIADTIWLLRKHKWIILATVFVISTVGILISLRTTRKYEAVARIALAKEDNEGLGFKDVQTNIDSADSDYTVNMDTQTRILQSDRLALEVISNLHLDQNPAFAGSMAVAPPKPGTVGVQQVDRQREAALLGSFHDAMKVKTVRNTRIIEISFRSPDPVLAASVVNNIVSTYVEDNYRTRYESTMQASDWLAKQISDLQMRVETSQEKLVRYQRENGMLGIDEKQNIITQKLDDLNKSFTDAQADRITKQAAYETAKAGKFDQLAESANGIGSSLRQQEAILRAQYAQLTTTFGPNYPKTLELKNQIDQTERSIQAENQRALTRLEESFTAAGAREAMLGKALNQQKVEANQLNEKAIEYSILKRDLDANRTLYEGLLQKLKEAGVAAGLKSSNIRIVDNARVPTVPVVPNTTRNLMMSLLVGLLAGVALAILLETLDTTVRTSEEAQALTALPSLGFIPHSTLLNASHPARRIDSTAHSLDGHALIAQIRPNSEVAESFRSLRTSILLSSAVKKPRLIMFTSPMPQEGKTTTSVNMAIVLAQRGGKVLLIDADLRRPGIHRAFGCPNSIGLSSVLAGLESFEKVIQNHEPISNLSIMPTGPTPPHPAELLGSDRMQELLAQLSRLYDHIILDSPPVNLVTDPAVLSQYMDAVFLVVRSGKTSKNALRHATDQLSQIKAPLIGLVVNDARLNSVDYNYRSYYGHKQGGYYVADEKIS